MQGELEIPVQVTAEIDFYLFFLLRWILQKGTRHIHVLEKYRQTVVSDYKELRIDGHFDDCTKDVLKGLDVGRSDTDEEVQSIRCNNDIDLIFPY